MEGTFSHTVWFCLHFFCCLSLVRLHSSNFDTGLDWCIDSLLKCSIILWTGIPAACHCCVSGGFWYYPLTPELRGAGEHWMYLLKVNKPVLGIVSAYLICEIEVLHPCLSIPWTVYQIITFSYGLTWLFSSFMWHRQSFTHVPSNGSCWLFNGC